MARVAANPNFQKLSLPAILLNIFHVLIYHKILMRSRHCPIWQTRGWELKQFVLSLKATKLEEATVEAKQFTSEPALLLISELPSNWVRNHTYLRWGVLKTRLTITAQGLARQTWGTTWAEKMSSWEVPGFLHSVSMTLGILHVSSCIFVWGHLGSESSSISITKPVTNSEWESRITSPCLFYYLQ